jgi:hypothetical protein
MQHIKRHFLEPFEAFFALFNVIPVFSAGKVGGLYMQYLRLQHIIIAWSARRECALI